jgi:receptor protein-tyrosine kinase
MPWTTTARVIEEFRIIKRKIMFPWQLPEFPKAQNRAPRVVMVTSSRPREGKTYCSINLALAFAAEENLVTVLIDADAVRGDAAKILGVPSEPGFTDILSGESRLHDVLMQSDIPNLVILPPGSHGPHVPELLAGRGPNLVFAEIASRYPEHVIILDTPPCLASTDPAAFAPIVNQIVFVIEAGHTQQGEIESSLNLISSCQHISFLLNKTEIGSSDHFGSYSSYYNPEKTVAEAGEN